MRDGLERVPPFPTSRGATGRTLENPRPWFIQRNLWPEQRTLAMR
jgi:hypothetical protein